MLSRPPGAIRTARAPGWRLAEAVTEAAAAAVAEDEEEEEEEDDGSLPSAPLPNHELKNPPPAVGGAEPPPSTFTACALITSSKDSAEVPAAEFQLTTIRITRPEDIKHSPTVEDAPVSVRHTSPVKDEKVHRVG